MNSSLNIIVCGEAGAGKSSVINLIAGRHVADTSPDSQTCTLLFKPYSFTISTRTIHIWDTAPFSGEVGFGFGGYHSAIQQARGLVNSISTQGGVDLLLFCICKNRVTGTTQAAYEFFVEKLCGSAVQVALVITNLEREADMEKWWDRNEGSLARLGLKADGHACVTGLPTHSKYRQSQCNIARLLEGFANDKRLKLSEESLFSNVSRPSPGSVPPSRPSLNLVPPSPPPKRKEWNITRIWKGK